MAIMAATTITACAWLLAAVPNASGPGQAAPEGPPPKKIFIAAYAPGSPEGVPGEVLVSVPTASLDVTGFRPVDAARPLLIIVDPDSISRSQASAFLSALAAEIAGRRIPSTRLGIAVLDGILLEPVMDPAMLDDVFARAVRSYFPERNETGGPGAGRFFDLAVGLLQASQKQQGNLDCIILARDGPVPDEEPDYVSEGMERKLLTTVLRTGTTVYGRLSGAGIWHELCSATGGEVFSPEVNPAAILDTILDRRSRGLLIEVRLPLNALAHGRHDIALSAPGADSKARNLEGPRSLWSGPGLSEAPSYYEMRQGLDWRRRSRESEREGNRTVALQCMENSIQNDPWNGSSFYEAGRLAAADGDFDLASRFLSQAIGFAGAEEQTLALYASIQERLGRAEAALDAIRTRNAPAGSAARKISARLLAGLGRFEEARAIYSDLAEEYPQDSEIRAEYGRVLLVLGEERAAREQLEISRDGNPGGFAAALGLSEIALAHRDLEAAAILAGQAVAARPEDPDALFLTARIRLENQDPAAAGALLRKAYELHPHRQDILAFLADLEVAAGRIEEAKRLLNGAVTAYPGSPQIYRALARVNVHAGDTDAAAAVLETGAAHAGAPGYKLYQEAAEWRERRAEYGQALLDYRAALDDAPREAADELKDRLEDHVTSLALLMAGSPGKTLPDFDVTPSQPERGYRPSPHFRAAGKEPGGLVVPGGIDLLAKTAGMEPAALRGPDALGRLFAFVLKRSPVGLQQCPPCRAVVDSLRDYRSLLRYIETQRLWESGSKDVGGRMLSLRLTGSKAEREAAGRFLKFFGVSYRLRDRKGGSPEIIFALKGGRKNEGRRRLLNDMGLNIHGQVPQEIQIRFEDGRMPLLLDTAAWKERILARPEIRDDMLLENMLTRREAMLTYVALEKCSERTRTALLEASADGELLEMAQPLRLFGRFLDVQEDGVRFPGSGQSWRAFLNAAPDEQGAALVARLMRSDHGRGLGLYYFLAAAPESARLFFTSTPENLSRLCSALPALSSGSVYDRDSKVYRNLGRLAGLIHADEQGLFLNLDPRFDRLFFGFSTAPPAAAVTGRPVFRLDMEVLSPFMRRIIEPASVSLSNIELLEFLTYAQGENPAMFDDATVDIITADPRSAPVCLNLIWSLLPPAHLAARYLEYCRRVAGKWAAGWNENRARTSQALFYLISRLHRRGSIDREEGRALLDELVAGLAVDDEPAFVRRVTAFLTRSLLPMLKSRIAGEWNDSDLLWRSLAGPASRFTMRHGGLPVECSLDEYRLKRMKSAVVHQDFIPLSNVLELLKNLESVAAGTAASPDEVRLLVRAFDGLPAREAMPDILKKAGRKEAQANLDALARSWSAFMTRLQQPQAPPVGLLADTASALHLELGISLLTYCYACEASPETDPLVFDPHFVRRHSFFPRSASDGKAWMAARVQRPDAGVFIEGALSGLGSQLGLFQSTRLAGGQPAANESDIFTALLTGLRGVAGYLRSDRAQEYVALTARLGREIVTLASVDARLMDWCEKELDELLLPSRLEATLKDLRSLNPSGALARLAPSELLLLGNAYLSAAESRKSTPAKGVLTDAGSSRPAAAVSSPLLDRLAAILPEPDTPDAERFREEVSQYGIYLEERLGLSQSSFGSVEPYEQIEGWGSDRLLFERMCDLKIQLAELGYASGWPSGFGELAGEVSLDDFRPRSGEREFGGWQLQLQRIATLSREAGRRYIEQCVNLGYLSASPAEGSDRSLQKQSAVKK